MQLAFAMAVVGFSTPHARSHLPAMVAIPGARAAPSSVHVAAPRAHRVLLSATPPTPPPRRPPPETPPSGLDLQLCLLDGNVLLCYSLLASIGTVLSIGTVITLGSPSTTNLYLCTLHVHVHVHVVGYRKCS